MGKPRLLENPEYCPGGYDLHLYCKYENDEHGFREFPHEITEYGTWTASVRAAREYGWLIHADRTAICPKCVTALGLRRPAKKATP